MVSADCRRFAGGGGGGGISSLGVAGKGPDARPGTEDVLPAELQLGRDVLGGLVQQPQNLLTITIAVGVNNHHIRTLNMTTSSAGTGRMVGSHE